MNTKNLDSKIVLTVAIIFIVAFIVVLAILNSINTPAHITSTITIAPGSSFTFNGVTYSFTLVAANLSEQEKGLMNATVNGSTFELFVFSNVSIYPFWMKDTYYPLDIIWVNGSRVVYIVNATPCSSYDPNQSACLVYNDYNQGYYANYVIEAQAGFVNRTGMAVGSTVKIN